ncbi:MAG: HAMP domain-containing histidine kinase, partial [Sulfuritalea sp.]|nr:HAMP domain-containing histidine kinase [Sulfuritalea sp.]
IIGAVMIRITGDISLGLVSTNSAGILIIAIWAFFSGGIHSVALPVMLANLALLSTFGDVAMLMLMGSTLAVALVFLYRATAAHWLPASFIPDSATSALMLTSMLGSAGLVVLAGVSVARDRARVKSHLRSAQLAAEQSSRAKSVFLTSVSNEFREPLTTILSLAEKLRAGKTNPLDKEQLDSIDHVSVAGRHLLGLLTQVLDMSRIEAGELRVEVNPISVNEILLPCMAIFELEAQRKEISLLNATGSLGEAAIWADHALLKQVILNLLSNAVKFNHKGGTVTVFCEKARPAYLRIGVTDTGRGIAVKRKNELFVPFARLGEETGSIRGAGLGLAIAKQLTEKMRGRIGFDSTEGLGSTFWIELPLAE